MARREHEIARARGRRVARKRLRDIGHGDIDPGHGREHSRFPARSPFLCARRVADYWIVNLREAVLEIYRRPALAAASRLGWEYRSTERLARGATVSPLAAPGAHIAIDDLLPPE